MQTEMPTPLQNKPKNLFLPILLIVLVAGVFLTQVRGFSWGTIQLASPATITVTGHADGSQLNQKAHFYATVNAENVDKDQAVKELTEKTNALVDKVKNFGIEAKNIKTQNLQVYEYEDILYEGDNEIMPMESDLMYRVPGRPYKTVKKWKASNSLSITVEDASKSSELSTLLINSDATDVSGPSFEAGDTAELEKELLAEAMKDAEAKANTILKDSKQKIVKIIQVSESGYIQPYPIAYKTMLPMAGGGMEDMAINLEPGSQEMTKTITVIFEIR